MMESEKQHIDSILLRPVEVKDFELVLKWENDPANWVQSGIIEPYTSEEIKNYVQKSEDLITDGQIRYMIQLKNGNTIGCIDLFDFEPVEMMANVGLLIDGMHRGNGYGSAALQAIDELAIKKHQLKKLKALILSDNDVSVHLFSKHGYKANDTKAAIYHYNNRDYLQLAYFKSF